jgi:polynucleotide 5'-kinase involved in rRNA processing
VAAIQTDDQLGSIVNATKTTAVIVYPPTVIKKRGREERRRLRELAYRKHLANSICRNIDFTQVKLVGAEVRNGRLRAAPQKLNSMTGFLDDDELLLNIGILKGVEQKERNMKVYTPFRGLAKTIEFGAVKLDPSGKELTS